jgi:3-hydroxyisobutyrate dehydrogenase/glyoxylate/succinic semialdehyde reductase
MKVGFIGLGIMGSRMAANLQKSGVELVVSNRTRSRAEPLLAGGALWADTPHEVGRQVDVLFSMLATPAVVEKTSLGENGFLESMAPHSMWVDCSTVNPSFSKRMAQEAQQRQIRFVDAPVAGSKDPAAKAQLVILAGGSVEDVAACRDYFTAMGRQVIHAGPNGAGASLKMVFNLLLGLSMASFAEALTLGEALGLQRETMLDALAGSIVVAPSALGKRAKIEAGDYAPDFPLQWMQKDLQLAAQSAYEQQKALPVTNAAKELYMQAIQAGLAEKDLSAVYAFLSGKPV